MTYKHIFACCSECFQQGLLISLCGSSKLGRDTEKLIALIKYTSLRPYGTKMF